MIPWDQRAARKLIQPLAHTSLTPNHLTALTVIIALCGCLLFTLGEPEAANWGAGLFVVARFLDHFDGELARLTGKSSRFGYYFDYLAGAISYAGLFLCIGIGLRHGPLENWALVLGILGGASALISMPLNLGIDRTSDDESPIGYPGYAGFELEDGIYLLAPITWLGYLSEFFVLAGVGAGIYCVWTATCLARAKLQGSH